MMVMKDGPKHDSSTIETDIKTMMAWQPERTNSGVMIVKEVRPWHGLNFVASSTIGHSGGL